jgi:hypothetical protein
MQGYRSHSLSGSQGQETSAHYKNAGAQSHSLPSEPGIGIISMLKTCRGTEVTHSLVSKGQESSASLNHARA